MFCLETGFCWVLLAGLETCFKGGLKDWDKLDKDLVLLRVLLELFWVLLVSFFLVIDKLLKILELDSLVDLKLSLEFLFETLLLLTQTDRVSSKLLLDGLLYKFKDIIIF